MSWRCVSSQHLARIVIYGVANADGTYSMNPADTTWRASAAKMFTVVMRDINN